MQCYHPLCVGRKGIEKVPPFKTLPQSYFKAAVEFQSSGIRSNSGEALTSLACSNSQNWSETKFNHSTKRAGLRDRLSGAFNEIKEPIIRSTTSRPSFAESSLAQNATIDCFKRTIERQKSSKGLRQNPESICEEPNLTRSLERQRKELKCFYECSSLPFRSYAPPSLPQHPMHCNKKSELSSFFAIKKLLYSRKTIEKNFSESYTEGETESPGDTSSPGSDEPNKSSTFSSIGSLDVRTPLPIMMERNSPFGGGNGSFERISPAHGRISPCHDLGYHTLVTRQTPTPTRDRKSSPSPWPSEVRASPFPGIDLSALSSCPRSSPRPQLPQVPPISQQTPSSGINSLETTDQILTTYKGKKISKGSPFDRLTNELIIKVFSFLPSHSLCQAGRVCRKWYNLSWHSSLWKSVTLTGETLHVDRAIKQVFRLLSRETGKCDQVEKIILNGCSRLTDRGLSIIGRRCPDLRQLEIRGCTHVTNAGIFELVTQCINLENLDVTGCHNITCINLTHQGATVEPDPLHSRQLYLQYLDMTDCYGLQDQGLKVIVKNCPQLLHLYLRRCINITDIGMKHLASYCLMLREVSISDCMQITDFGMYELAKLGPNLRYLSVAKCDQISDAGIKQIARHCYKLRYLNVRGCEAVSDDSMEMVARSCPRLRALDIGKCDVTDNGMKLISENCPNLKKLSVKSCDMITDLGIQYIAYYCRGLQQLNIQDCQVTTEGYRTVKKFCRRCIIEHTNPGFF